MTSAIQNTDFMVVVEFPTEKIDVNSIFSSIFPSISYGALPAYQGGGQFGDSGIRSGFNGISFDEDTYFGSMVIFSNSAYFQDEAEFGNIVDFGGRVRFAVSSSVDFGGSVSFKDNVIFDKPATFGDKVVVKNNVNVWNNISCEGTVMADVGLSSGGCLYVGGAADFDGSVEFNEWASFFKYVDFSDNVTFNSEATFYDKVIFHELATFWNHGLYCPDGTVESYNVVVNQEFESRYVAYFTGGVYFDTSQIYLDNLLPPQGTIYGIPCIGAFGQMFQANAAQIRAFLGI